MSETPFDTALRALLESRVTANPADLAPWLTDWRGRHTGAARALASPETTQEVAAIVRLCGVHDVPIVPQGGKTGMVAGGVPDARGDALILSLRRMNRIDPVAHGAGVVRCGAGTVLQTLDEALAPHGLRFPLTLGARGSATVGGLIATNAGGTQALRHGTMRALVLGLEAVLPDGSVIDDMAALRKDNRGYALPSLLVGSEGTLGIVTRAALKLVPRPVERAVAWCAVPSPRAARALLTRLDTLSGAALEGFELMPDDCVAHVLDHVPGTVAPIAAATPWHVLVEWVRLPGDEQDVAEPGLDARAERWLSLALDEGLLTDAAVARTERQAETLWRLRDSISEAERRAGPAIQHDIAVAPEDVPAFLERAAETVARAFPGTSTAGFGHMGDGNIHYHVRAPAGMAADRFARELAAPIAATVHALVADMGGTISAEHGIGRTKIAALVEHTPPARIAAIRAIKHALDPKGIMNPGVLVPNGETIR